MITLANNLKLAFPDLKNVSPIIKIGKGFESSVVKTNSGIVFKRGKNIFAQNSYKKEFNLLRILNRHFKTISIPLPIYFKHSTLEFPYGIIGYKEIPGKILSPSDITLDNEIDFISQFVNIINTIHSIPLTPEIDQMNLSHYPPLKNDLKEVWKIINPFLKSNFSPSDYNKLLNWWNRCLDSQYAQMNQRFLIHLDLWYENIVISEEKRIVGILDFGNISLGDPIADLVPFSYINDDFMYKILNKLQKIDKKYTDENLFEKINMLKGLRELFGLEYGIKTNNIDKDSFTKIQESILY